MTTYGTDPERDAWTESRVLARELDALEREPSAEWMDDKADRVAGWSA